MSYAGTYGPKETCPHGCYWRSCQYCSTLGPRPTPEQIQALRENQADRKKAYLEHPVDAENIIIHGSVVVVFDAKCRNKRCQWQRTGFSSRETLELAIALHVQEAHRIANQWRNVNPEEAYIEP